MSALQQTINLNPRDLLIKFSNCTSRKLNLAPNNSAQVLAIRQDRIYALVINLSAGVPVTLLLGEGNAVLSQGVFLANKGSSFEIGQFNLYTGRIAAIAPTGAELSIVECVL